MVLMIAKRALGFAATALAFFYLIRVAMRLDFQEVHLSLRGSSYGWLFGFVILYGVSCVLLAWGWFLILRFLADREERLPFQHVAGIHFRTNMLKYIPGNFMEFVGRNYMIHRYGISHGDSATSSILETIFLILSSLFVTAVFSFASFQASGMEWHARYGWDGRMILMIVIFSAALLIAIVARWSRKDEFRRFFSVTFLRLSVIEMLINSAIITWLGLLMVGILVWVMGIPMDGMRCALVIGSMALSWTCGFVTPGAPGGLGVREAILLMLLSSAIAPGTLIMAAALHRLVSILGDAFIFGIGSLIPVKGAES